MTENNKKISENTENKLLTDDQLENVSGGEGILSAILPKYKRCSADPTHVYSSGLDACPVCGAK